MEDSLKESIAYYFNVEIEKIMGHSRKEIYVLPRHIMMYILREKHRQNFEDIGKLFDRHHTTVISAVREVKNRMLTSELVRKAVKDLTDNKFLLGVPKEIQDEIDVEFSEAINNQEILKVIAFNR